jgi:hypothetical protein
MEVFDANMNIQYQKKINSFLLNVEGHPLKLVIWAQETSSGMLGYFFLDGSDSHEC